MDSMVLTHHGILGMRWGVRRYQNKNGTLTPLGKQHLAENRIRTEDNLVEKTIPKGTKMYRTTPKEKDGNFKSTYVTYLDVDRNLYREGSIIKSYIGSKSTDSVYEHQLELKTDIRIPSLKKVREIEQQIVADEKHRREVAEAYTKEFMLATGQHKFDDIKIMTEIAKKIDYDSPPEQRRKNYNLICKKYGDYKGDEYYNGARSIAKAEQFVNTRDSLIIERSLGQAKSTKESIIKELQKQGYNAMYDNAGIGVKSDGSYTKTQEGVEPLIIFDAKSTLKETGIQRVDRSEQQEYGKQYDKWTSERDDLLRKFK